MVLRRTPQIPPALLGSPLAGIAPDAELEELQRLGTALRIPVGRAAIVEDAIGRECMLVVEGSFVVERNGHRVAELHPGDFMGEVALLTRRPRNATVTAAEDSTVLAFSRAEFASLLRACPVIGARVRDAADGRTVAA